MHLEISQLNVHLFHAAPAALFFRRLDAPDNDGAQDLRVEHLRGRQIRGVDGKRSDGFSLHPIVSFLRYTRSQDPAFRMRSI